MAKSNYASNFLTRETLPNTTEYQEGEDELMPEVSEGSNKNPATEDRGTDE